MARWVWVRDAYAWMQQALCLLLKCAAPPRHAPLLLKQSATVPCLWWLQQCLAHSKAARQAALRWASPRVTAPGVIATDPPRMPMRAHHAGLWRTKVPARGRRAAAGAPHCDRLQLRLHIAADKRVCAGPTCCDPRRQCGLGTACAMGACWFVCVCCIIGAGPVALAPPYAAGPAACTLI